MAPHEKSAPRYSGENSAGKIVETSRFHPLRSGWAVCQKTVQSPVDTSLRENTDKRRIPSYIVAFCYTPDLQPILAARDV